MMAETVYLLCATTSIVCAIMLLRGYRASRTKLLFWSCLCFAGLALNNVLLFLDLVLVPQMDLSVLRSSIALGAMMMLIFGLVWEWK
jgi:hydrogenase/urease accessory protein HupE